MVAARNLNNSIRIRRGWGKKRFDEKWRRFEWWMMRTSFTLVPDVSLLNSLKTQNSSLKLDASENISTTTDRYVFPSHFFIRLRKFVPPFRRTKINQFESTNSRFLSWCFNYQISLFCMHLSLPEEFSNLIFDRLLSYVKWFA